MIQTMLENHSLRAHENLEQVVVRGTGSGSLSDRLHAAGFVQADMPAQRLVEIVRSMPAQAASGGEVIVECLLVVRVHTVIDDDSASLPRAQSPRKSSQSLFGYQNIDVMLCVVDVADHRHYAERFSRPWQLI